MKSCKSLNILIITCLVSYNCLFAQEQKTVENDRMANGFYLRTYFAPTFNPRPNYKYFHHGDVSGYELAPIVGLQAGYQLNNYISLKAGVEYFVSDYHKSLESTWWEHRPASFVNATYNVNYYQFPFLLDIYLSTPAKKRRWYLPLGMVYRKQAVREKLIFLDREENIIREENNRFSENYKYISFGIGNKYKINNNWFIFAELPLRYGLPQKINNSTRYTGPTAGLNLGANYFFR